MNPKTLSYTGYLDNIYFKEKETGIEEIANILRLIDTLPEAFMFPDMSYFAVDYTTKKYILLKGAIQKIWGHHPMDFFNGGLEFSMHIVLKDDFAIYNKNIFSQSSEVLKNTPQHDHQKYSFSHNKRIIDKDGQIRSVVQKGRYITSPDTGFPLYFLGMIMDVTPYKKDTCMITSIDKYDLLPDGPGYKNIVTNYFYPCIEDTLLTRREKEILYWIAEGYSIKHLAVKLNLTESTITNHRVNILRKTNTKNVAHLIAVACRNGII